MSRAPVRAGEAAAEHEQGVVAVEALHDVEHERAAAHRRQAADVDQAQPGIGGQLGDRLGAFEVRQARVVRDDHAQARPAAELAQHAVVGDDGAVGPAREPAQREAAGPRHGPPGARRDVLLGHDLLGHVLVHVAHEARHERPQQGEQGEQLGVVNVHHEGPQPAQLGEDLAGAQPAAGPRARRQGRPADAVSVAAGRRARREIRHVVAGLRQGAALAFVDPRFVRRVDDRDVDDGDRPGHARARVAAGRPDNTRS